MYAFRRCGVPRAEVGRSPDHFPDLAMAGNLVLADLATEQPNLWKVTLIATSLTQGTTQYLLPANVLLALNFFIRTTSNTVNQDRVIYEVSRSEYDAYPNKALQQPPTVVWVNRVVPIQLNLYPAPDQNGPYILFSHCVQQDDDAAVGANATLDLPYRMYKAYADGLAAELSLTYAPERAKDLAMVYEASKARAHTQDRENVPLFITPGLQRYYRA